ncbi:MAG: DUF2817 domain-containing protein [Acidobacteria bacterium]|nr:DUF2817 domain-containing protein [Acidobacteriota bacterium]MYJ03648.1 DUF2817 domain-containing protein [Acidobacteriota bacterium]
MCRRRSRSPDPFSPDYATARQRFRVAAHGVGAELAHQPVDGRGPDGEALTIDVALMGARTPERAVVVSSGLHGVEGFIGSAIQLAWLRRLGGGAVAIPADTRVVLLHGLNPYGFAWRRRVNERNVDLNRNFLDAEESYRGVPPGYGLVHGLLNPPRPPDRLDAFPFRAGWAICRHGLQTVTTAVAAGQYDHPDGLFFGGLEPEESTRLVQAHYDDWIGTAATVVHLDLHSGLGRWGRAQLIVEPDQGAYINWYREAFRPVRTVLAGEDAPYAARGTMGTWLARRIGAARRCRTAVVEFGTYSQVRVLAALRAEQAVRRAGNQSSLRAVAVARTLMDCFCPNDRGWRQTTVQVGDRLVEQALAARVPR